jgi:hypothetical protein
MPTKERIKMLNLTTRTVGPALAAMTIVISCAMLRPGLVGHDALRNSAEEMKVNGRSGDTFKKMVVFGPFHTDTINIGSAKVNHDRPRRSPMGDDISIYTNATQGFHFTQYDSAGNTIGVQCLDTIHAKTTQYGSLMPDEVLNSHCEIHLSKSDSEKVFLMYMKGKPLAIPFGKDSITMTAEDKSDPKEKIAFQGMLFTMSGETVAAVSLTNEGLVWIKRDMDNECKLLIAAISTAMLVQPNLESTLPR